MLRLTLTPGDRRCAFSTFSHTLYLTARFSGFVPSANLRRLTHLLTQPLSYRSLSLAQHPPYGAPEDYFNRYSPEQVRAQAPLRQLQPGNNKPPHLGPGGITGYRNITCFWEGTCPMDDKGLKAAEDLFYYNAAIYLGRIAYVDFILGELMKGLAASPLAATTALFAHSDHGDYQGDWGAVEKWPGGLEDVLTRVPLLASVPGGPRGLRVSNPVMSIDLFPTMIELAQANATSVHFGLSLLPWITRGKAPEPSGIHPYVFSEGGYSQHNEYEPYDPAQASVYDDPTNLYYARGREEVLAPLHIDRAIMIRNATAKMIYRPRGTSELYDLVADPQELWNVYPNASYAGLRSQMTADLLSWLVLSSDFTPSDDDDRGLPPSPVPPFPWPPTAPKQQRRRLRAH